MLSSVAMQGALIVALLGVRGSQKTKLKIAISREMCVTASQHEPDTGYSCPQISTADRTVPRAV